jgi:hypothetical protein
MQEGAPMMVLIAALIFGALLVVQTVRVGHYKRLVRDALGLVRKYRALAGHGPDAVPTRGAQ